MSINLPVAQYLVCKWRKSCPFSSSCLWSLILPPRSALCTLSSSQAELLGWLSAYHFERSASFPNKQFLLNNNILWQNAATNIHEKGYNFPNTHSNSTFARIFTAFRPGEAVDKRALLLLFLKHWWKAFVSANHFALFCLTQYLKVVYLREVVSLVFSDEFLPLFLWGVPRESPLNLQDMKLDLGLAGRMLPDEGVGPDQVHLILLRQTNVKDALKDKNNKLVVQCFAIM